MSVMGGAFGGQQDGLPFAGVPHELRARVDALVASEPEHRDRGAPFRHRPDGSEARPLSIWRLVFAHWPLGLASILLVAVVSVANQAGPRLVNAAIDQGMVGNQSMRVVTVVAGLLLASVVLTVLAQRWLAQVSGRLAARVMDDLRNRVFTHLQRLSLDFFTREKAGVVMTRMTSDIENLQQLLQEGLAQIAVQALTMVVITTLLLTMDVQLTLLMVALTIPPLAAMSTWFRTRSTAAYLRVRDGVTSVLSDLSESLRGVRLVTAHNRAPYNVVRHRTLVGEYRDANLVANRISSLYGSGSQLLGFLSQALLLGVGGQMVLDGRLTIGELVAFFLYFNRFFQPIQMLVQQYSLYQQGQSSILKLRALLAEQPSVMEAPGATDLAPVAGEIHIQGASFGYEPGRPILDGIDLTIAPGETVAFVGPTGAGKSTLAKLVMRLYDVTGGRVLVDGTDVRDVTLTSLRRQVVLVPQEAFLFAGTLHDNVAFGRPDASDDEVRQAVAAVGLTGLVDRLPRGLDTEVHERGQSLSAGERQLVALARAFLAQPRILVLDEATANLDLQSEMQVEQALDALLQDRTAILIAHRLTTAMKSDRIVVIEDGRIAESGSHDDLLGSGGPYAQLYEAWIASGDHRQGEASATSRAQR